MKKHFCFMSNSVTKKIIFTVLATVAVMLLLPLLAIKLSPPDGAMGAAFLLFFAANPIFSAVAGVVSASDIRRLWWLSALPAVTFPLLFSIAISEFVPDLYIYSAIYLVIAVVAMLITLLIAKKRRADNSHGD